MQSHIISYYCSLRLYKSIMDTLLLRNNVEPSVLFEIIGLHVDQIVIDSIDL